MSLHENAWKISAAQTKTPGTTSAFLSAVTSQGADQEVHQKRDSVPKISTQAE